MVKSCRLCLKKCIEYLEIFNDAELDIPGIISKHFWFQPSINDNFSQLICSKCWECLKVFHDFYQAIQNAQDAFHNVLKAPIGEDTQDITFKIESSQNDENSMHSYLSEYNNFKIDPDSKECLKESEIPHEHEPTRGLRKRTVNIKKEETDDSDDEISKMKIPIKRKKGRPKKIQEIIFAEEIQDNDTNLNKIKRGRPVGSKNSKRTTEDKKLKKQTTEENKQEELKREEEDKRILEFFKLECDICHAKFMKFIGLRTHYRVDHSVKHGYVMCCNKKLLKRCILLEHLDWHFNPNKFRCTVCAKVYSDKYCLKLHMASHASEKAFCCDICGKSYATKNKLSHHLSISHKSEEDKIHKCLDCGKSFPLKSILMGHVRRVHELADTTVCDICAKVFKSRNQCMIHYREEHGEKRQKVQCKTCGAWLKNSITLYSHMRRQHYDIARSCDICGKIAPNKESLRDHIRFVHTMKPTHKCNFCDKSFKQLISLKEHQASHTGDILYVCPYCPKTFNSNSNMWSHRKNKHPEEWLRDRNSRTGPIKLE